MSTQLPEAPPPDRRLPLTLDQASSLNPLFFSGKGPTAALMLANGCLWRMPGGHGLCLGVVWRTKHQALREDDREHEWFLTVEDEPAAASEKLDGPDA